MLTRGEVEPMRPMLIYQSNPKNIGNCFQGFLLFNGTKFLHSFFLANVFYHFSEKHFISLVSYVLWGAV